MRTKSEMRSRGKQNPEQLGPIVNQMHEREFSRVTPIKDHRESTRSLFQQPLSETRKNNNLNESE